jgi:glyoxylase-like metal-dependent hydrolase (beta-lactamase superfamily II)
MNRTDDWYDVSETVDGGYRIVEADRYGQFLVPGDERALLVDAGVGVGDLRELVSTLVDVPVTLVLTHGHWDHIGGAAAFDDVRVHADERAPDGRVAIDGVTEEFIERPAQFVASWLDDGNGFPDDFDHESHSIRPTPATTIAPGETISVGDRTFEVLHTPGHARGHVSLLDRDAGVLYGGDVLHFDAGIYAHFEHSDLGAYRDTFERLADMRDDGVLDALLTSHNPTLRGDDLSKLARLRDGLDRILASDIAPERVDTAWGTAHRFEVAGSPVLADASVGK